jgi:putative mycofactocin binding protein MftB
LFAVNESDSSSPQDPVGFTGDASDTTPNQPEPQASLAAAYALHSSVAVRPEPFGALVYHYGNRKLVFLKSPKLVAVVEQLSQFPSAEAAITAAGVAAPSYPRYVEALSSLLRSDMIVPRPANQQPMTEQHLATSPAAAPVASSGASSVASPKDH